VRRRRGPGSEEWFGDKLGPGVLSLLSVVVFALAQTSVMWSWPIENLQITHYILLTFGALIFVVAGLYLPRLSTLGARGRGGPDHVSDGVAKTPRVEGR
jgi:protein-S-isoprenylcysteine O-methyltransferase Ste14